MKAQNLAVSIPNVGCDKNCPYCVSAMTGYIKHNPRLFQRNLIKVITIAKAYGVESVIFTGKGEPCLNMPAVIDCAKMFGEFPIELQTNGYALGSNFGYAQSLYDSGVNTIAISIDKLNDFRRVESLVKEFSDKFIFRATINLTKMISSFSAEALIDYASDFGFKQMSLREVVAPNYAEAGAAHKAWIDHNVDKERNKAIISEFSDILRYKGRFIRKLPYGASLFGYKGLSLTYFEYCIQDNSDVDNIRSLIYQEDGHLYSAWNAAESIIF